MEGRHDSFASLLIPATDTTLTFSPVTESNTVHATIRLANSSTSPTAHAYYPWTSVNAGDAFFAAPRDAGDPLRAGRDDRIDVGGEDLAFHDSRPKRHAALRQLAQIHRRHVRHHQPSRLDSSILSLTKLESQLLPGVKSLAHTGCQACPIGHGVCLIL